MNDAPRALSALAALLYGAALMTGCAGAPSRASTEDTSSVDAPLVPSSGVYLGLYYGDGDRDATDRAVGRTPQIDLTYVGWEDPWTTSGFIDADRARGQLSLVNWEPFGVDLTDVVDGAHDEMLRERAEEAAALEAPVFVDLAAEMNEEEGWGGHDPDLYIAAYRHVHDVFAGRDGGNVVWVWAPNNVDSAGAPAAVEYYPGDEYVDWTGIDGYNWGTSDPDFAWEGFEEVFREVYDDLHEIGKPIMIGETASAEDGGSKADWIADVVPTLEEDFPDIRAVVWFDVDKERDWRIRSSDASAEAFRELAGDPLFQTTTS